MDARQARQWGTRIEAQSRASNKGESTMSKPTHIAYVVTEPKEGKDRKPIWRAVGAIWPHKNGAGFDLVIHDQIAVSGRIVCTETKERPAEQSAA